MKMKRRLRVVVGFIYVQPHKGQNKIPLDISFSKNGIIRHAPNGPIYIIRRIIDKPNNGILVDHVHVENVITGEFLFVHEAY